MKLILNSTLMMIYVSLIFNVNANELEPFMDKPLAGVQHALTSNAEFPNEGQFVNCMFYPNLMVKQVYHGDMGMERISITNYDKFNGKTNCTEKLEKTENVIKHSSNNIDIAYGYYIGKTGKFLFIEAPDSFNGGHQFHILNEQRKLIYSDIFEKVKLIKLLNKDELSIKYTTVFASSCSLYTNTESCWRSIQKATNLKDVAPPNCREDYEKMAQIEHKNNPQFTIESLLNDPTVIYYDVKTIINSIKIINKSIVKSNLNLKCHPSE